MACVCLVSVAAAGFGIEIADHIDLSIAFLCCLAITSGWCLSLRNFFIRLMRLRDRTCGWLWLLGFHLLHSLSGKEARWSRLRQIGVCSIDRSLTAIARSNHGRDVTCDIRSISSSEFAVVFVLR